MHNVEDLVGEFARVDVAAMCVVRNEGDIKRANVRDVRKTLEEVMLQTLVNCFQILVRRNIPNPCSR